MLPVRLSCPSVCLVRASNLNVGNVKLVRGNVIGMPIFSWKGQTMTLKSSRNNACLLLSVFVCTQSSVDE